MRRACHTARLACAVLSTRCRLASVCLATLRATRVGAIRTRLDALAAQASLLRAVGVLPRDLGLLRADIDAQAMGREMVAVLNEFDVPIEARRALLNALRTRKNGLG